ISFYQSLCWCKSSHPTSLYGRAYFGKSVRFLSHNNGFLNLCTRYERGHKPGSFARDPRRKYFTTRDAK
ncbi:hypothetical protein L9F63_002043, partial [Diploptera punctata]